MKAMVFSDLVTSRNSFGTLLGITLFVAAFIAVGTGTLITAVASMAAMVPFMYLFSISAYDEMNGWERFRLTLPLSRRQVAYGRYASMLVITGCTLVLALATGLVIGAVAEALPAGVAPEGLKLGAIELAPLVVVAVLTDLVVLATSAVTLPLIMRFGMTKGTRLVPVVMVLALAASMAFFGNDSSADLGSVLASLSTWAALAAAVAGVLALYGASAALSARLYEQREL